MARILLVNFKLPEGFDMSSPEAQKAGEEAARFIAAFPGLKWKIWVVNEETGETGGIYLFEDEGALKEYLKGPTIAQVRNMMRDITLKEFGVIGELTQATRGPV